MSETKTRTVIPALPGWFVVEPISEDDGIYREFLLDPVVAWVIVSTIIEEEQFYYHDALPITVEGNKEENADLILKRPDNRFTAPCDREFNNSEEVIEYLNEQQAARRTPK